MQATESGRSEPTAIATASIADSGGSALAGAGTMEPLLLRASEIATALNLGRSTVYQMLASGELPTIRIGRSVRVSKSSLLRWISDRES